MAVHQYIKTGGEIIIIKLFTSFTSKQWLSAALSGFPINVKPCVEKTLTRPRFLQGFWLELPVKLAFPQYFLVALKSPKNSYFAPCKNISNICLSMSYWYQLKFLLRKYQDFRRQSVDSLNGGLMTSLFCPVGWSVGNLNLKKVQSYEFFSCLEKLESVGRVKKIHVHVTTSKVQAQNR